MQVIENLLNKKWIALGLNRQMVRERPGQGGGHFWEELGQLGPDQKLHLTRIQFL